MSEELRIATRESPLALWQANYVKALLEQCHKNLRVKLVPMTTRGDQILDTPLSLIGGKGLFIKELERSILEGKADIAVHSLKDVPMELPQGFVLAAITERAEVRDALVSSRYGSLEEIPAGGVLGSSSLRRQMQIRQMRPDLNFRDLRGNLNTRLKKLDAGDYDAIILASCGLQRLNLEERISQKIETQDCIPAAGQAAIGVEITGDDLRVRTLVEAIDHLPTRKLVMSERHLCARLGATCNLPVAAYAEYTGDSSSLEKTTMRLNAFVGDLAGRDWIRVAVEGLVENAMELADKAADELLVKGARDFLAGAEGEPE